jgi:hypothetical protein
MTTIIASYCYDSQRQPAVVLGADFQASYTTQMPTKDAIYLVDKKILQRKIQATPDEALIWAMAGCVSDQYRDFCKAVSGHPTKLNPFNLVDELSTGRSRTVADLNLEAMTRGSKHLNPENRFNLVMVYRSAADIQLWHVTETGAAIKEPVIFAGSGKAEAQQMYESLSNADVCPGGSHLQREAWLVYKSLNYATQRDSHSSGVDIVIIRKGGMEQLTRDAHEAASKVYYDALGEKISGLEPTGTPDHGAPSPKDAAGKQSDGPIIF